MLSLPVKNRRKKQPYLAIRSWLFHRQIAQQSKLYFNEIQDFMMERGIPDMGVSFLRYNMIKSTGEMDIEFGCFTERLHGGQGPIRAGILPGGAFVSVTWNGSLTMLDDVRDMLIGWGNIRGVDWDCASTEAGTFYGCCTDIISKVANGTGYRGIWSTEVAILVKPSASEH